jgi:flagellar basal body rod protein FlgC
MMTDISVISGSALQALSTGLQTTANNVASLNSATFTASRTNYQENGAGGVISYALRTQDTVSISREAADLISERNGSKANLTVLKAADEMTRELLNIRA